MDSNMASEKQNIYRTLSSSIEMASEKQNIYRNELRKYFELRRSEIYWLQKYTASLALYAEKDKIFIENILLLQSALKL
jgi:hypothetical protein